jgi:hypothetical protein
MEVVKLALVCQWRMEAMGEDPLAARATRVRNREAGATGSAFDALFRRIAIEKAKDAP